MNLEGGRLTVPSGDRRIAATRQSPAAILPATLRDLRPARALERLCFGPEGWGYIELFSALLFPNMARLKAMADGYLVGLVIGDRQHHERLGWIATIAVHPEHQRRGIGATLLAACESALGEPRTRLTVRASNAAAIALYHKTGYHRVSVWPGYYSGGEDAWVMEKSDGSGQ